MNFKKKKGPENHSVASNQVAPPESKKVQPLPASVGDLDAEVPCCLENTSSPLLSDEFKRLLERFGHQQFFAPGGKRAKPGDRCRIAESSCVFTQAQVE